MSDVDYGKALAQRVGKAFQVAPIARDDSVPAMQSAGDDDRVRDVVG